MAKRLTAEPIMQERKKKFKELYPEYGTVGGTLKAIGIKCRGTFYDWCDRDPVFKTEYENELLPNRRDIIATQVYQTATNKVHVTLCPVCEGTGKYDDKNCHGCKGKGWVEVRADGTQLLAAFSFLKATEHIEDKEAKDRLTFVEKSQVELSGKDGGPVLIRIVEDGNS